MSSLNQFWLIYAAVAAAAAVHNGRKLKYSIITLLELKRFRIKEEERARGFRLREFILRDFEGSKVLVV